MLWLTKLAHILKTIEVNSQACRFCYAIFISNPECVVVSWGRRTALCALALCAGALGVLKSFMPHYRAYLALEFLEAALGYGFNSAAYVMSMSRT